MKTERFIIAAFFLAACDGSPTDSGKEKLLLGAWEFSEAISSGGYYTHELIFTENKFVSRTTSYGVYPGSSPQSVSAGTEINGTYRVEDNKLFFNPASLTTWDSFYENPGPHVQRPYPYGSIFDDCRFEIVENQLTLTYLSYPAEAPVTTKRIFKRRTKSLRDLMWIFR